MRPAHGAKEHDMLHFLEELGKGTLSLFSKPLTGEPLNEIIERNEV